MASASVTRRYRFCAAHRLHSDFLTPEENCTVFGKCNNPNGHGHNYVVFVTVSSGNDPQRYGAADIQGLDAVVADTIIKRFDHRDLNQDPLFTDQTTTGENLVVVIWDLLQRACQMHDWKKWASSRPGITTSNIPALFILDFRRVR